MKWVLLCALGWLATWSVAGAQEYWTAVDSGTTQDLRGLCTAALDPASPFDQSLIVVGAGGTILTSSDGSQWTAQESGTSATLMAVTYGFPFLVAVGNGGTILTSLDGVAWTIRGSSGPNLNAVISTSENYYVAVGDGGAIATSIDGVTWTWGNTGLTQSLYGLVLAGDFTVDAFGQNNAYVGINAVPNASAPNGIEWTYTPITNGAYGDLNAEQYGWWFVQVGSAGYLNVEGPGDNWKTLPVPNNVGLNAVAVGADGGGSDSWGQAYPETEDITTVGDQGTILFAVGPNGPAVQAVSPTTATLYGVDEFNSAALSTGYSLLVAVGAHGTIVTSPLSNGALSDFIEGPQTISPGGTAQFTTNAQGWAPITYQWYFNGKVIPGATGTTYTVTQATAAQQGTYTVAETDALGTNTVGPFTLTVASSSAVTGLVDETFNPALSGEPWSVLPLPNGEVFVTGNSLTFGRVTLFELLKADGTPDAAFNANAAAAAGIAYPPTAFLQSDGKIMLVSSGFAPLGGQFVPAWSVRLNPNGTVDGTYAPHLATYQGIQYQDELPYCQLANGDYLVLPGTADGTDTSGGMVRRLTPNGANDASFVPWQLPSAFSGTDVPAVFDTHGRPWVADLRLNADGSPDPSFTLSSQVDGYLDNTAALGDQLLVALQSTSTGQNQICRLNSDGSLDPAYNSVPTSELGYSFATFAPDGSAYVSDSPFVADFWYSILGSPQLPPSTATGFYQGTFRNGVVRFDGGGAFDPKLRLNVYSDDDTTSFDGMVFANSSQMYAWGGFSSFNGEARSYLVRINPAAGEAGSSLINVSARAATGAGSGALTAGFIVAGTGTDAVLVRGVGPTLASYGVTDALFGATLTLYNGQQSALASNTDWRSNVSDNFAAVEQSVGAFPLTSDGDTALLTSVAAGNYTARVSGAFGATGVALAEVYDVNLGSQAPGAAHLSNVSARALTSPGANTLTVGFVVEGPNNKRVLIRATGPGLLPYGVTGVLPDPDLKVFQGQTLVSDGNALPGTQAAVIAAVQVIGAFSGADEAVCLTLAPGDYTAQVASPSGSSGVALLEVYEVP